jgi:hypothetical protein
LLLVVAQVVRVHGEAVVAQVVLFFILAIQLVHLRQHN